MMRISQEELHDILSYEPKTGMFTWKHSSPSNAAGDVAGKIYDNGYRYIAVAGNYYPAALLAWIYVTGRDPETIIDHRNNVKSDDSFENLRPATNSQNHANKPRPRHNTSGIKGVFWNTQRRKWQAKIMVNYVSRHIGFFDDIVEAAEAYRSAAIEAWGEFALVPTDEEIRQVAQNPVKRRSGVVGKTNVKIEDIL